MFPGVPDAKLVLFGSPHWPEEMDEERMYEDPERDQNIQSRTEKSSLLGSPPPDADVVSKSRPVLKTYLWRWVVLGVFALNNAVTNYIWIMSASVANVMTCYYNVSDTILNLLSTSYMMMYIPLMWPVTWIMDKRGLRITCVLSSGAMALGAAFRVAGSSKERACPLTTMGGACRSLTF